MHYDSLFVIKVQKNWLKGLILMLNGSKIKNLRITKRLSLRELCNLAERQISPSYLSELETGKISNPSKKVTRALAKALKVSELELFTFEDYVKGEFNVCEYRREFPTMNGWVYYCDLVATAKHLTAKELAEIGCTVDARIYCQRMMEFTCGVGIVPEPKE